MQLPENGLYAITPDGITHDPQGLARIEQVLRGGAVLVQYRDTSATFSERLSFAGGVNRLCHELGRVLIINDDVEIAGTLGAGVHLGRGDAALESARGELGVEAIIGASCYNDLGRAAEAARAGASYLAFGSVFPSPTKPRAVHCPLALLQEAARSFSLPVVAIGGITIENGGAAIEAGADFLAVITNLFVPGSEKNRAAAFSALFNT